MLKGFQNSRKEDGDRMRSGLAREMDELKSEVRRLKNDTQNALGDFRSRRESMTKEMQKELAQSWSSIKREVEKHLRNVQKFLQGQRRSRKQAGRQLRKDLAQSRFDMVSEVKQMQDDFNKVQAEIRADLKEAAAIWKNQSHIVGMTGRAKLKKKKEMVVTQAAGKRKMPEQPQPRNLEAKLLAAIEEHLDGITLAEAAQDLGVAPVSLGRTTRILLDKGKIRKAAKLYFPEKVK
jgi:F0F1-type ATP synthase membrane subunit b/b'